MIWNFPNCWWLTKKWCNINFNNKFFQLYEKNVNTFNSIFFINDFFFYFFSSRLKPNLNLKLLLRILKWAHLRNTFTLNNKVYYKIQAGKMDWKIFFNPSYQLVFYNKLYYLTYFLPFFLKFYLKIKKIKNKKFFFNLFFNKVSFLEPIFSSTSSTFFEKSKNKNFRSYWITSLLKVLSKNKRFDKTFNNEIFNYRNKHRIIDLKLSNLFIHLFCNLDFSLPPNFNSFFLQEENFFSEIINELIGLTEKLKEYISDFLLILLKIILFFLIKFNSLNLSNFLIVFFYNIFSFFTSITKYNYFYFLFSINYAFYSINNLKLKFNLKDRYLKRYVKFFDIKNSIYWWNSNLFFTNFTFNFFFSIKLLNFKLFFSQKFLNNKIFLKLFKNFWLKKSLKFNNLPTNYNFPLFNNKFFFFKETWLNYFKFWINLFQQNFHFPKFIFFLQLFSFLKFNLNTFISTINKNLVLFSNTSSLELNYSFIYNSYLNFDYISSIRSFLFFSTPSSFSLFFFFSINKNLIKILNVPFTIIFLKFNFKWNFFNNPFFFIKRGLNKFLKPLFKFDHFFHLDYLNQILFSFSIKLKLSPKVFHKEFFHLYEEFMFWEFENMQEWILWEEIAKMRDDSLTIYLKYMFDNKLDPGNIQYSPYFTQHQEFLTVKFLSQNIEWKKASRYITESRFFGLKKKIYPFNPLKSKLFFLNSIWLSLFNQIELRKKSLESSINKKILELFWTHFSLLISSFWDIYWSRWLQLDNFLSFFYELSPHNSNLFSDFLISVFYWHYYFWLIQKYLKWENKKIKKRSWWKKSFYRSLFFLPSLKWKTPKLNNFLTMLNFNRFFYFFIFKFYWESTFNYMQRSSDLWILEQLKNLVFKSNRSFLFPNHMKLTNIFLKLNKRYYFNPNKFFVLSFIWHNFCPSFYFNNLFKSLSIKPLLADKNFYLLNKSIISISFYFFFLIKKNLWNIISSDSLWNLKEKFLELNKYIKKLGWNAKRSQKSLNKLNILLDFFSVYKKRNKQLNFYMDTEKLLKFLNNDVFLNNDLFFYKDLLFHFDLTDFKLKIFFYNFFYNFFDLTFKQKFIHNFISRFFESIIIEFFYDQFWYFINNVFLKKSVKNFYNHEVLSEVFLSNSLSNLFFSSFNLRIKKSSDYFIFIILNFFNFINLKKDILLKSFIFELKYSFYSSKIFKDLSKNFSSSSIFFFFEKSIFNFSKNLFLNDRFRKIFLSSVCLNLFFWIKNYLTSIKYDVKLWYSFFYSSFFIEYFSNIKVFFTNFFFLIFKSYING